jgi:predicted LPLAT superfamily acyltransferase
MEEKMDSDLVGKLILYGIGALIVLIISAARKSSRNKSRQKASKNPEILQGLKKMHQNGANYEEMVRYMKSKGIPRAAADSMIADLE